MPENPLLPNRKLHDLYTLLQRCRSLDLQAGRRQKTRAQNSSRPIAREAVLAATSMHLLPGDLLSADPGDRAAEELAPAPRSASRSASTDASTGSLAPPPTAARLLLCAAAARGLQAASGLPAAGAGGLVLAYAGAGPANANNAGWAAALEWAHAAQLPLLLVCFDTTAACASAPRRGQPPSRNSAATPLVWPVISRVAKRLRLPLLPVDGEDAIAVYRVMQECALRARQGGGPAVVWAILSSAATGLPRARRPIPRLKSYLTARGITPP